MDSCGGLSTFETMFVFFFLVIGNKRESNGVGRGALDFELVDEDVEVDVDDDNCNRDVDDDDDDDAEGYIGEEQEDEDEDDEELGLAGGRERCSNI
jgi:hypothetical protein